MGLSVADINESFLIDKNTVLMITDESDAFCFHGKGIKKGMRLVDETDGISL